MKCPRKTPMKVLKIKQTGLLIVLISCIILPACQNTGNKTSATDESNPDIIKKEVILSPETQDLLNRFPTPFEVTNMLQEAGAPYIFSLTNSPENVSNYFTEKTKALNLGVYSTDLAYSSVYQRADEIDKFLFCTGKLAGDLGIGGVYDKDLLKKANSYKDKRDSLISLVRNFTRANSDFLRRNNRTQVAVLVAAGAFAEGLYITSSLCLLSPDNNAIRAGITSQKESLGKLLLILGEYGEDSNLKPVADELSKLKDVFTLLGQGTSKPTPKDLEQMVDISGKVRASLIK